MGLLTGRRFSPQTVERCTETGADTFVAGSAVFGADDPNQIVNRLPEFASAACQHCLRAPRDAGNFE